MAFQWQICMGRKEKGRGERGEVKMSVTYARERMRSRITEKRYIQKGVRG